VLEEEIYHIINYFPHWVWAWVLLTALAASAVKK
jgi:hypothetical protein